LTTGILRVSERFARAWREGASDAEMHWTGYRAWREHLARFGLANVQRLRVLEIGCGDRAQLSLLFASDGAAVVGLDQLPVALGRRRPGMWLSLAREQGIRAALRAVGRDLVHTARYWRHLARLAGRALPVDAVHLVRGDAARLPFPDESFDLVVSSAVWEHLPDVEAATREVDRVLRHDGVAVIQIALFPALQGGHHPDWHSSDPRLRRSIRPWDHLRPDRNPLPTYLNEWREGQYRAVLERCLRVIEWEDGSMRGAPLLDETLRADLAAYSERDLLLSSITAWAGKAGPAAAEATAALCGAPPASVRP
jgi:SAM-dependent methyltransferase